MKIKTDQRINELKVKVLGDTVGLLQKKARFEFIYETVAKSPVSVTMPLTERSYQSGALFPIFEMNIPEGFIRHRITELLRKEIRVDEMLFLALQGNSGIGRISYESEWIEKDKVDTANLAEILSWEGDKNLFEELVDKYLFQSNISGIQPKVMVPEDHGKGALVLPSLIVKCSDVEFPQLALNEYICMRLAEVCDIETPEFWLSDNHELFVMRRFDLDGNGSCRAMEDMAVLQGKLADDKYRSSYESVVKAINLYSSSPKKDCEILFKMIVHSCMVGNGDAHLKNFAMLYDDTNDMRLSPLYDVVNTQIYKPRDTLALNLGGSKEFPDKRRIIDFGKSIGVKNCEAIIENMADNIRKELDVLEDYIDLMNLDIKAAILQNIHLITTRTGIKKRAARRHRKFN